LSDQDIARYQAAAHAMQSGVLAEHQLGSKDGTPKHLRVGVNSAQVSIAALAGLLIQKGVFTLDEYERANADEMEIEKRRYEERLGVNLA
jgi:hypothetical protein